MILHLINKAPSHSALRDSLPFISASDAVILIDDGVYAAISNTEACQQLQASTAACYALADDVATRGITVADNITLVTMADFVDLCFDADKTLSWY